jgi:rhodanese-related sulfurtransferase
VLAAETLVKLGYTNVRHLYGGWVVWEGGPEALDVEEEVVEEGGCGG